MPSVLWAPKLDLGSLPLFELKFRPSGSRLSWQLLVRSHLRPRSVAEATSQHAQHETRPAAHPAATAIRDRCLPWANDALLCEPSLRGRPYSCPHDLFPDIDSVCCSFESQAFRTSRRRLRHPQAMFISLQLQPWKLKEDARCQASTVD